MPVLAIALNATGYSRYPLPTITQVNTSTIPISATAVTIDVFGSNFFPDSVARINGVDQPTVYSSSSQLQVTIDPSFLNSMTTLLLRVANPAPGGGRSSAIRLTVYNSISLQASALVYDSSRNLLYAAIPAAASSNPNSVVAITPGTGHWDLRFPSGMTPMHLRYQTIIIFCTSPRSAIT